jgi:hypothetical protein
VHIWPEERWVKKLAAMRGKGQLQRRNHPAGGRIRVTESGPDAQASARCLFPTWVCVISSTGRG